MAQQIDAPEELIRQLRTAVPMQNDSLAALGETDAVALLRADIDRATHPGEGLRKMPEKLVG